MKRPYMRRKGFDLSNNAFQKKEDQTLESPTSRPLCDATMVTVIYKMEKEHGNDNS